MTVCNRGTHKHIELTASADVAGVKRPRRTAFIGADALQLSAKIACSYTACARDYQSRIYLGSRYYRRLRIIRMTRNLKEGCQEETNKLRPERRPEGQQEWA